MVHLAFSSGQLLDVAAAESTLGFPFSCMLGDMKNNLDGASGRYEVGLVVNSVVLSSRWTRAGAFHKALRHSV